MSYWTVHSLLYLFNQVFSIQPPHNKTISITCISGYVQWKQKAMSVSVNIHADSCCSNLIYLFYFSDSPPIDMQFIWTLTNSSLFAFIISLHDVAPYHNFFRYVFEMAILQFSSPLCLLRFSWSSRSHGTLEQCFPLQSHDKLIKFSQLQFKPDPCSLLITTQKIIFVLFCHTL